MGQKFLPLELGHFLARYDVRKCESMFMYACYAGVKLGISTYR